MSDPRDVERAREAASVEYDRARVERDKARVEYDKARVARDEAWRAYDEAWWVLDKAKWAYDRAGRVLDAVAEAAQAHIVDTEGDIEEPCDIQGCLLCKTRAALAKLEDL